MSGKACHIVSDCDARQSGFFANVNARQYKIIFVKEEEGLSDWMERRY